MVAGVAAFLIILAIMMIVVVLTLLSLTVVSDLLRIDQLSSIGAASLFPIAILTILRVTEMVRFRSLYGPESRGEQNA